MDVQPSLWGKNASYLENNCADQNVSMLGKVDRPLRGATVVNGDDQIEGHDCRASPPRECHLAGDSATPLNTRSKSLGEIARFLRHRSERRYANTGLSHPFGLYCTASEDPSPTGPISSSARPIRFTGKGQLPVCA